MVDFVEAVKRPLKTDPVTVVLGIVFRAIPVLDAFVYGLGVDAARRTQQGKDSMPAFHDFVDAFFSGLMTYVIVILYFIPALAVLGIGVVNSIPILASVFSNAISNPGMNPALVAKGIIELAINSVVFGALTVFLGLMAALMLPIAISFFSYRKKIGDAFLFGKILNVVATAEYWVSTILLLAYAVVLVGLSAILSTLSGGILFIPAQAAAGYLWLITAFTLYAETVRDSGELRGMEGGWNSSSARAPARKFAHKRK